MKSLLPLALLVLLACASSDGAGVPSAPPETQTQDMIIQSVEPHLVLPGSKLVIKGAGFVPGNIGASTVTLTGTMDGSPAQVTLAANWVSPTQLEAEWPAADVAGLPASSGELTGDVVVSSDEDDGLTHTSLAYAVGLDVRESLQPQVSKVQQGVIFVNDPIVVEGDGFLLGGLEGDTVAVVDGCFRPETGTTCDPVAEQQVTAAPVSPYDRTRVAFPFAPEIAGIHPGTFEGTVKILNRHGTASGGVALEAPPAAIAFDLLLTTISSLSPTTASLGQYVDVQGAGFVGLPSGTSDPSAPLTTLQLDGTFLLEGQTSGTSVSVSLVPDFVSGNLVRYVLNEQDELGSSLDLRQSAGTFSGTIRPVVRFGTDTAQGDAASVTFSIAHVKQVVWLNFLPAYIGSLRRFGLRAVDQRIRDRVMEVSVRDYAGINVEFRFEEPSDFAQYAQVDISGPDPNGSGLLGYDNTPGKDTDNTRLYDKIGGVNATTQQDGYPGYGGVFVESFFGFSTHPGTLANQLDGATAAFDQLFDPFRPDVAGGAPVTAQDLATLQIPVLHSTEGCPASDRGTQIGCAVFVLGSLIGTTMTHEVAHSLGLADPYGGEFHNVGDQPNRLMDAGGYRTFNERAELNGEGPGVFCDEDYQYLRKVLPTSADDPLPARPPCW